MKPVRSVHSRTERHSPEEKANHVFRALKTHRKAGLSFEDLCRVSDMTAPQVRVGIGRLNALLNATKKKEVVTVVTPLNGGDGEWRYILASEYAQVQEWQVSRMKDLISRLESQQILANQALTIFPEVGALLGRQISRLIEDCRFALELLEAGTGGEEVAA